MLLLDELINIAYDTNELWFMEFYDDVLGDKKEDPPILEIDINEQLKQEYLKVMHIYCMDTAIRAYKPSNQRQKRTLRQFNQLVTSQKNS